MPKFPAWVALTMAFTFCVPAAPEAAHGWSNGKASGAESARTQVDVNHASVEELMKVPGLSRPWAERIVRFRPYRSKLDLFEQGVVPGPIYFRIREFIIAHRESR